MKANVQKDKKARVVVFGIFDGVHEGHRSLFTQAREYGDELVAIVGRDEICLKLKNKIPHFPEQERLALVGKEPLVDRAVLGDEKLSLYVVLEDLHPDFICVGYDQQALYNDLLAWTAKKKREIRIVVLKPFQPDIYRTSLLQKNR